MEQQYAVLSPARAAPALAMPQRQPPGRTGRPDGRNTEHLVRDPAGTDHRGSKSSGGGLAVCFDITGPRPLPLVPTVGTAGPPVIAARRPSLSC